MNAQEAYEHCNKTGEPNFIFTKDGKPLRVAFREPYDMGEVYIPSRRKIYLIQQFYDGWKATPKTQKD